MLKDVYLGVQKQWKLPDFGRLDHEFSLSEMEDESFPLRQILARMMDVLHDRGEVLHVILQPDTGSLRDMCECRFFTEVEKRRAFDLFRRLMVLVRSITEAGVISSEENDAEVIRLVAKEWPGIRADIVPFASKMKESWTRPMASQESGSYLG